MVGVTLITPTGDRPEAFRLCEYWISRQTYRGPLQWVVVDDGMIPIRVRSGQDYVRRDPQPDDPPHTMCKNLRLVWDKIKFDNVLVIEDDDYYSPGYVETMIGWLGQAELVGEVGARYYFVRDRRFRLFVEHEHASLCRTGFQRSVLPLVKELSLGDDWRLDLRLWSEWKGRKKAVRASDQGKALSVSIKGMPGRVGKTHNPSPSWTLQNDRNLVKLDKWLGRDHELYLPYLGGNNNKSDDPLIVYTCCTAGYDRLQRQPVQTGVSYVAITDGDVVEPWQKRPLESWTGSPRRASRRAKLLSHDHFPNAMTLYIDANLVLFDPRGFVDSLIEARPEAQLFLLKHNVRTSVEEEAKAVIQMRLDNYKRVRAYMKRYNGLHGDCRRLAWGGCILRRPGCELFNELWWQEYDSGPMRDQLSLPYAACESGVLYHLSGIRYPLFPRQHTEWMTFVRHRKQRMELERGL